MERVDAARPRRASWPDVIGEPFGRVREPRFFLILTVATLGVYPFYFHAAAHAELLQQLGRKNRDLPWLFAAIGLLFFSVILREGVWWVPLGAAIVLFAFYVHLQVKTLHAAQGLLDLPREYHVGTFFLRLLPGALILVGPFFAYKRLVEEYNLVWRAMAPDRWDEDVGVRLILDRVKALGSPASKPTNGANPTVLASPPVVPKNSLHRSETHGGTSRVPTAAGAETPSANGHARTEKPRSLSPSHSPDRPDASPSRTKPPVASSPKAPPSGEAGRQGGKPRAFSVRDHRQWNRDS